MDFAFCPKRHGAADFADKAMTDTNAINCVDHADNGCAKDGKGIDKSAAANKCITQTRHDQYDRDGVDRIQNGNRNAENCIQSMTHSVSFLRNC